MKRLTGIIAGPGIVMLAMLIVALAPRTAKADDPAFLAFSAGYFDILAKDDTAFEGRVEYRSDYKLWFVKPFVGLTGTSDGAVHAYGGILSDIYFGRRWVLTPSFAPGYFHDGGGKDLGSEIEFRSQIELSYRFDDRSRLGISFNHISNAGIGDANPGTETLAITYAIPLGGD
ncbi:acyloxyacyl hydrolase [Oceanibacterium hippocampi]|uniref:Lipid A 3-O-deacylase (PagL) n=1 Tax=Oceanibacterium hippocampi TaxID=745714 RepID=A0A1Y5R6H5_9PROT|nr:acyloxyacyl hydrolase [Oceanibacterium hippocampi]SLN10307.1 Lipid A 3-O-deacylase (PagL) [Oceanibacterium hippocampi]